MLLAAPVVLGLSLRRLRSSGYGRTLAAAQAAEPSSLSADEQLALARETDYALAVAVKYGPWRPRCLLRSLALGWFLGRRGIPFGLRIGVPGGKAVISPAGRLDLAAHAWVEVAGVVVNDSAEVAREFRPLA